MAERLVLFRRGALGDVVLLGAVTAAWSGPVTVICDPRWAGVAERLMGVDQVLPWGSRPPAGRHVDLQGGRRGRMPGLGARRVNKRSIRRRVGLWMGWKLGRPSVPELYGEAVGVAPVQAPWIALPAGRTRDALALVPGAAWSPKQPQVQALAAVGRGWSGPVFVLGGPGEHDLVQGLASRIPGAVALWESGFERTLTALAQTRVMVSGDTGLMHLAGATGAAVVGLFGPTHPSDGFFVYRGEVVQRMDLDCRPCTLHRQPSCPLGHGRCMQLDAQRILEAVQRCGG